MNYRKAQDEFVKYIRASLDANNDKEKAAQYSSVHHDSLLLMRHSLVLVLVTPIFRS
jgi:hypothetical protein